MNAAEHYDEAERLLAQAAVHARIVDRYVRQGATAVTAVEERLAANHIAAAQVHAILALAASTVPRDTAPEAHSTAWCAARDAWDTVESGRRFDGLDRELQAALAARWQRTHG